MKTINKECQNCNKPFQAPLKEVERGNGRFCCQSCSSSYNNKLRKQQKKPNVSCAFCNISFYKSPSSLLGSKSGLFFCCREHKDLAQRIGGIEAIQPSHYNNGERTDYRNRAFNDLPHKCNRCGYDEIVKILEVHHKDYNRENNHIDNLEILCPNCHAIEHRT